MAFQVPAVIVPRPVMPVYEPEIAAVGTVPLVSCVALRAVSEVPTPEKEPAVMRPEAVRVETVVVAKVEVPVTSSVPPNVPLVPMLRALAAEIPPEVLMAPVIELVVSKVLGANSEAAAPVPPIVRSVVAPAKAVNETDGVVILVVMAGEVILWIPVNV